MTQIRKVGNTFLRILKRVKTKKEVDWEVQQLKWGGLRYRVEKQDKIYIIWYAPADVEWQALAKRGWGRRTGESVKRRG